MTSAQVRRALEKNAAERTRLEAELKANIRERLLLDQIARLHSDAEHSKLPSKMRLENAGAKKKSTKISAALSEETKPGEPRDFLLKADKTPADIAAELKVGRSTVQAWLDGRNGIPRIAEDYLLKKYGIPASAWPKRQD